MIALTVAEIAALTHGEVHDADPQLRVEGAAFIDSREPVPGGLFCAFAGERVDGHQYAAQAVAAGAAAVLAERPVGVPAVVVADAQAALQQLARDVLALRRASGPRLHVIGITGSQGKTSVKDLLAGILARVGPTVATYGSFNNELGLPLTVLRTEPETRFLILEMGARGKGHIADLCAIAAPNISLVLNVGKSHIGEFGSQEAIAEGKGELVEALTPAGTAVLNADDPRVLGMRERTSGRVLTFGTSAAADVALSNLGLDEVGRAHFDIASPQGEQAHVQLQFLGEHHALNAAAAAAAALACGVTLGDVADELRSIRALSKWRMELHERPDGALIINDAYNANPDSMTAALRSLAAIGERSGRRTIAVVGQMLELGASSTAEHEAVGALAADLGIDELVGIGEGAAPILVGAQAANPAMSTRRMATRAEASAWLGHNVFGPDVVLVKASRADGLEEVAQAIVAAEPARRRAHDGARPKGEAAKEESG